jgi:hypothetical protein
MPSERNRTPFFGVDVYLLYRRSLSYSSFLLAYRLWTLSNFIKQLEIFSLCAGSSYVKQPELFISALAREFYKAALNYSLF